MAAGIAHELKNPLAGIEVMAGLLRRQVPDKKDAQSLLADILSEAKLANAIVVEMLEFVRPVRLQVEHTAIADVLHQSVLLAESKAQRGSISVTMDVPNDLPQLEGDQHQLCQMFTNLIANAFEALEGKGAVAITASMGEIEPDPEFGVAPELSPTVVIDVRTTARAFRPSCPIGSTTRSLRPRSRAPASASASSGRSSTPTMGASICTAVRKPARGSG
jgi:signal transduction histidine kinase